jgi:putative nucleotidyltransferase with HDIG domain
MGAMPGVGGIDTVSGEGAATHRRVACCATRTVARATLTPSFVDDLNLGKASARALRAHLGIHRRDLSAVMARCSSGSSKASSIAGSIFVSEFLDRLAEELATGDREPTNAWAAGAATGGYEHCEYGTLLVLGCGVIASSYAGTHADGYPVARYLALRGKHLDRICEKARVDSRRSAVSDPARFVDQDELVTSLLASLEARDAATCEHSRAVGIWSERVARTMGLTDEARRLVSLAGTLHDIGKLATPKTILLKPGPLDEDEWSVMRDHSAAGARILEQVPSLRACVPIVRSHHERIDGLGYPDGLAGSDIPLASRIVAVADAFHAMISNRPYRGALPAPEALAQLEEGKGIRWDSLVVEVMFGVVRPAMREPAALVMGMSGRNHR